MASRIVIYFALGCLVALTTASPYFDDDGLLIRTRRGVQGYAGVSRPRSTAFAGGYIRSRTQQSPAYAQPDQEEEDVPAQPEEQPWQDDEEDATPTPIKPYHKPSRTRHHYPTATPVPCPEEPEQPEEIHEDLEEEEVPTTTTTAAPVKVHRHSRAKHYRPAAAKPTRPIRPPKPTTEEPATETPSNGDSNGGAHAVAASYSVGEGATSKSHAVAVGGSAPAGEYRQRHRKVHHY